MMTTKRILFAVLCVLLILVIIMTGIVISKVKALFRPANPYPTDPSGATQPSATESTPISLPTQPSESIGSTEPGHEHAFVLKERYPASCDSFGWTEYVCECGRVDVRDRVDPLGHNYGHGKVVSPTCTDGGYTEFVCTRCGYIDRRDENAALGHAWDAGTEMPATCTEDACTLFHCTREGCQETKKENIQEGTATGHTFGEWETAGDGTTHRFCQVCGQEETMTVGITSTVRESAVDDAGTAYVRYTITVGTAETPNAYIYTILDYLDTDPPSFRYVPEEGLIVTYTDAEGQSQTVTLEKESNQELTISAQGE
ncbi:MAG: hypothetical protein PUB93_02800 [Firmicutes bacterium]|nr:hypothetical protein [Bacillota bacterium]